MTRKERLAYCKVCQQKQFDAKRGLVCSLTNEYANFETECADFKLDERIMALNSYKKEIEESKKKKKTKPQLKQKKLRLKEQFSKNDWLLLTGFALLATFVIRLIFYAQFTYRATGFSGYFYLFVFTACVVAVFFRKSKQDRKWFFSDIKFKLLLASAIPLINLLYSWLIFGNNGYLFQQLLVLLIVCNILSILSAIIIIPVSIIIKKFKNE